MAKENVNKALIVFNNEPIRRIWSDKDEKWFFSVIDVVRVLTESEDARTYWKVLKHRLLEEGGNQTVTNCNQLKMPAEDGKMRLTDVADAETLFRLIQSIPSPKAEPFKLWLAKVAYERMKETVDPEIAVNRARGHWLALGRSAKWIEQRMRGQEIRNKLTDYWASHEIKAEEEFAKLTNIIHQEWSGISISQHKKLKKLQGHNLRDHMSDAELLFTALAELSTRQVAEKDEATGFTPNAKAAVVGGQVSGRARQDFEQVTGKRVVVKDNFLPAAKQTKKIKAKRK